MSLVRPTVKLAILSLLVGCGGNDGGPAPANPADPGPGDRPCTMIGCLDGLHASFETKGPLPPGHYTVDVEADGVRGSYEVDLPLPACDTHGKYTGELKFGVGESGCALPPDRHTLSDLTIEATPRQIKVRVVRTGTVLADVTLAPAYKESRPNGPQCEPVCNGANERIVLANP